MIAFEAKIDLDAVFSFPLTVYPLSIAQCDGSMNTTHKASLTKRLESFQGEEVTDATLPVIEESMFDGGLFLHSKLHAVGRSVSYGDLAQKL